MNSLESDDDEAVDRLSSLPESLILEILSFLETKEVVRTISLVSKGWKDLWTTIPYLSFNDLREKKDTTPYPYHMNQSIRHRRFINRVLERWKGTKILRFKISVPYDGEALLSKHMAEWARFATEKKVEDLDIYSTDLPADCIYSYSSFTKLSLSSFSIPLPTELGINVQWDRLKALELNSEAECINGDLLQQFVSSAPNLQVLDVLCSEFHGNLIIESSILKTLSLMEMVYAHDDPSTKLTNLTLTISAPNLEELCLFGFECIKHSVLRAPALIRAHFGFHKNTDEGALKQLFLPIQHVEALIIEFPNYKRLIGVMRGECLFSNVKVLRLCWCCYIEPNDIVCAAEFFPKVEKLVIDGKIFRSYDFGENYLQSLANNLDSLLPQNQRLCEWVHKERCFFCRLLPTLDVIV